MKNKHEMFWFDRGPYPTYIGFCPSKKAWKKCLKNLEVKELPYPDDEGNLTYITFPEKTVLIITIDERADTASLARVMNIITHECVHAFQRLCVHIGEDKPSKEFEAYTIGYYVEQCLDAYQKSRRSLTKESE